MKSPRVRVHHPVSHADTRLECPAPREDYDDDNGVKLVSWEEWDMIENYGIKVRIAQGLSAWAAFDDDRCDGDPVGNPQRMSRADAEWLAQTATMASRGIAEYYAAPLASEVTRISSSHRPMHPMHHERPGAT
jgi:hypothetical protein